MKTKNNLTGGGMKRYIRSLRIGKYTIRINRNGLFVIKWLGAGQIDKIVVIN